VKVFRSGQRTAIETIESEIRVWGDFGFAGTICFPAEVCQRLPKAKKADVKENPEVFFHVGLLLNEPLGTARLLLNSSSESGSYSMMIDPLISTCTLYCLNSKRCQLE